MAKSARVDSVTATKSSSSARNDAAGTIVSGNTTPGLAGVYGNTDVVLTITDDGSTITHYLDQGAGSAIAYTRSGTTTLTRACIGALLRSTAGNFWKGDVYGIVALKGVLSSGDRALLVTYMGAKQGRTI